LRDWLPRGSAKAPGGLLSYGVHTHAVQPLRHMLQNLFFNEIGAGFQKKRMPLPEMSKGLALSNLLFFLCGLPHLFDPLFVEPLFIKAWKA
jgi:hypothetical protein